MQRYTALGRCGRGLSRDDYVLAVYTLPAKAIISATALAWVSRLPKDAIGISSCLVVEDPCRIWLQELLFDNLDLQIINQDRFVSEVHVGHPAAQQFQPNYSAMPEHCHPCLPTRHGWGLLPMATEPGTSRPTPTCTFIEPSSCTKMHHSWRSKACSIRLCMKMMFSGEFLFTPMLTCT